MRHYIILLLFFTFCFAEVKAQFPPKKYSTTSSKAIKNFEKAQLSFDAKKDDDAIEQLLKAIDTDPNFVEAHVFLAEVYSENKRFKDALAEGTKAIAISPDFFKSIYYSMGFWSAKLQLYDEAQFNFKKYLSYKGISKEAKDNATLGLNSAIFAAKAIKNPVPFNPINMGPEVNSKHNDYLPAITADEQTLVYTMLIPKNANGDNSMNNKSEDFFITKKINGKWSKAVNLGPPINTYGNEGAQCISADGQTLIFTACKEMDGYPGGRKGMGSCDLFISYSLGNEKWSTPENMGAPVNSEYWDSQPSLAADGQTIFFISNRPGGKGGADMWKCTKNTLGKWSNLTNMGDSINTTSNEESPFIHPDGKSLYFSSDGWPGMGNKDIFLTRLKSNNQFGTPLNLGYPINTDENERDLIVTANGKTAFFSSERKEGSGGQDLYYFDLYPAVRPLPVTYVKGKVFDKDTKKGLRADFELLDLETGNKVMEASSNNGSGEYLICIPSGKNYAMNVSKKGYLFNSENFSLKDKIDLATFELNMPLVPIKAGEKVVLKNIFFETGSFKLKEESKAELQKLILFLTANGMINIEIGGHTDNVGDKKANELLSQNRAKAVYDYLVSNTVAATRLSYKGFGDKLPIASNETDEGKASNRRTEFTVMP